MAKKQGTPSSESKKHAEKEGRFSITTIKRKLREYQRILTLTRRPTREEFSTIAKVAAIGIIVIGAVGFAIYLGMVQAPSYVTNATKTQQTSNASTPMSVLSESSNTTSNSTSAFTNSTQKSTTGIATT